MHIRTRTIGWQMFKKNVYLLQQFLTVNAKCIFQTFKSMEKQREEREQREKVNLIQLYPYELHASN